MREEDPVVEDLAGALIGGRAARGSERRALSNRSMLRLFSNFMDLSSKGGSFIAGTLGAGPVLISS